MSLDAETVLVDPNWLNAIRIALLFQLGAIMVATFSVLSMGLWTRMWNPKSVTPLTKLIVQLLWFLALFGVTLPSRYLQPHNSSTRLRQTIRIGAVVGILYTLLGHYMFGVSHPFLQRLVPLFFGAVTFAVLSCEGLYLGRLANELRLGRIEAWSRAVGNVVLLWGALSIAGHMLDWIRITWTDVVWIEWLSLESLNKSFLYE